MVKVVEPNLSISEGGKHHGYGGLFGGSYDWLTSLKMQRREKGFEEERLVSFLIGCHLVASQTSTSS